MRRSRNTCWKCLACNFTVVLLTFNAGHLLPGYSVTYNLPIMAEPLEVEHYAGSTPGQGVLCLKGPITAENLLCFQNAVRRESASTMVLDMTEVPYIDSAGLGSLVTAWVARQKAGQRTALSGVNDRVLRLFQITHVEPIFLMFQTLEDALQALANAGTA